MQKIKMHTMPNYRNDNLKNGCDHFQGDNGVISQFYIVTFNFVCFIL